MLELPSRFNIGDEKDRFREEYNKKKLYEEKYKYKMGCGSKRKR